MMLFSLAICLSCLVGHGVASLRRNLPISALREHTIATYSRIANATSVTAVFTAGEQIPAIKLSVDKAVRILVADAEDGILAAHAIQQIATLSASGMPANKDSNIEEDRRFEQLTECVDLCVTALSVADLARYLWGMTVLSSTDEQKYANVISEYARRLSAHGIYKQNSTASANLQKSVTDIGDHVLTALDIAAMIWTVGCVKDVSGQSNHTFVREAAKFLSECMQFDHSAVSGTQGEMSVKLAVRIVWSLALHQVNLKPLISQCLSVIFPTPETLSPLTFSTSLTLLWCFAEFKYLDLAVVTKLLDTIVAHLPGIVSDEATEDAYQHEIAPHVMQLYSSLLVLHEMCSDIVMAEDGHVLGDRQRAAYGVLEHMQHIFSATAAQLSAQQLADAQLASMLVMLKALNTFDGVAALHNVLDASQIKIQACLDADSVEGADACALLQSICTVPAFPSMLVHEAKLATIKSDRLVASLDTRNASSGDSVDAHTIPLQRDTKWMRLAGRLSVKAALHCAENPHDSALFINTAYSLAQVGTYTPLTDPLYNIPLQCVQDLSADTCAKLLVTMYSDWTRQTNQQLSGAVEADPAASHKLSERLHYAQCVAEAVRGSVASLKSPLLQGQVIEALATIAMASTTGDHLHGAAISASEAATPPTHIGDAMRSTSTAACAQPEPVQYPVSPILTPDPAGPIGELRTKEGYSIFPFEEEEGVITDTVRLQALVRAAASGAATTTDTASSSLAEPMKEESRELDSIHPTPAVETGDGHHHPVSPILTPDPVGPTGEPRSKEGYTMFSFEEEEGLITDAERLKALVLAAANGDGDGASTSTSSHGSPARDALVNGVSPTVPTVPTFDRTIRGAAIDTSPPHTEEFHDTAAAYPISPLLQPDPAGPAGELRSKEGYTIFPFDEQEGVVTNTDRLQALVRAAASRGDHQTRANDTPLRTVPHTVVGADVDADAAMVSSVPILSRFTPRRLKYLPHHMLARLQRAYEHHTATATTDTTSYGETIKAIKQEIQCRDKHPTESSAACWIADSFTRGNAILLNSVGAHRQTSPSTPSADPPLPHFSSHLQSLLRDWATGQQGRDAHVQAHREKLLRALVAESGQIGSPAGLHENQQADYRTLLAFCDCYVEGASTALDAKGNVDCSVADGAFVAGVLQETLAQRKRQSIAHAQSLSTSSTQSTTLSLGKRLLTQFFRAFVN